MYHSVNYAFLIGNWLKKSSINKKGGVKYFWCCSILTSVEDLLNREIYLFIYFVMVVPLPLQYWPYFVSAVVSTQIKKNVVCDIR